MGTTNQASAPLLAFFEGWVVGDGPVRVRRQFEADEHESGAGLVRYSRSQDALVGILMAKGRQVENTPFKLTYADWLSRRIRPEVDRALTEFGNRISRSWSTEEEASVLPALNDEVERLRKAVKRVEDETFRLVLSPWLTRVAEEALMIAGQNETRRKALGGRPPDVDPEALKEKIARLTLEARYWHKAESPHAGKPNRGAISRHLCRHESALVGLLQPRWLDTRIKRALKELGDEGRLHKPVAA